MADAMLAGGGTAVVLHLTIAEAAAFHAAASAVLNNDGASQATFLGSGPTIEAAHRARRALHCVLQDWERREEERRREQYG